MTLVHEHPQYDSLLSIVADRLHVPVALVEKDYWVTHTLWSLTQNGLHVYVHVAMAHVRDVLRTGPLTQ
ncbi:MAG TPA: hypothetical protein VGO93_14925 [Candidatus Xenobia bacterium]|jgi:hypothetical protein